MSQYFDNKGLFMEPTVSQYGNHMVMTNVHKETKKKKINVDTRFSDEYKLASTASFTITLPERIPDVTSMFVSTLELPMSFYNISTALGNNTFTVVLGGTTKSIIIPDGQYSDTTTLAAEISSLLTAASISATVLTFTVDNNKAVFTPKSSSGNGTIYFDTDSSGNFDKYHFKSKLGWLLGFRETRIVLNYSAAVAAVTSDAFINVSGPRYLYLVVDEYSKGNQNSFVCPLFNSRINKNILARIAIDTTFAPFGKILVATEYNGLLVSDRRDYTGKIDLLRLNVQLIDELGRNVDLNGLDYSFCLEVACE